MPDTSNANPWLPRAFVLAVLCLAVFQFSENTADPDLWSHVFFGTQFLQTGKPTTVDYYSWTAYGQPSFDHEYLGEAVFGLAYLCCGGPGLLLLKVIVGLLTFAIALSIAAGNMDPKNRLLAWAFGALAVVEISFGFAARPQIFTALLLAVELWLLGRIHAARWRWVLAFPPLFALWFNLHGGALAGLVLLFTAVTATTGQRMLLKMVPIAGRWLAPAASGPVISALWISAIVSASTVVLNPHGAELARWLVGSVLWLRPQIQEWNPATLSWNHAAFFFSAALAAFAFLLSRRARQLWELAVLSLLFIVAARAVRNTPLFCVASLALVPPHLAAALLRFRDAFRRFENLLRDGVGRTMAAALLLVISAGILAATFTLHKTRFWTMEVPRSQYPVAAIQFIKGHDLHGNLLVYFDWGEMCIWDLPNSLVSIDGRLDSVYSPEVIAAHWKLYNGEPFNTNALNLARADFALLPVHLAGAAALVRKDGWHAVYFDDLAVVLVKTPARYPKLAGLKLPIEGAPSATTGRAPFPNRPPPLSRP